MDDFTAVPVLDLSLTQDPAAKPRFLSDLQAALVRVGFFYIKNHAVPHEAQQALLQKSASFFRLPTEKKLEFDIARSKHFSGYSRMVNETTAGAIDHSEAFLSGPDLEPAKPSQPVYYNLVGPNQWPDNTTTPGFRKALETYRLHIEQLSYDFTALIEEALSLETASLLRLFGKSATNLLSLRNYPPPTEEASGQTRQGVGAHKDVTFMTYLLQQGKHSCLEVQNKSGTWIPVPPIPGTLVVNIGRVMETLTCGVCTATTHRVTLRPETFIDSNGSPLGPRLSVAFFQDVDLGLVLRDLKLNIPPQIRDLVRGEIVVSDAEELFSGIVDDSVGDSHFVDSLIGFPEWGKRWYPMFTFQAQQKQLTSA